MKKSTKLRRFVSMVLVVALMVSVSSVGIPIGALAETPTPDGAIRIVMQPESYCGMYGDVAYFMVHATGVSRYQWQFKTGSLGSWTDVPTSFSGYNRDLLRVPISESVKDNSYRCILYNHNNESTVTDEVGFTIVSIPVGSVEAYQFLSEYFTLTDNLEQRGMSWELLHALKAKQEEDEEYIAKLNVLLKAEGYPVVDLNQYPVENSDGIERSSSSQANGYAACFVASNSNAKQSVQQSSQSLDLGKETLYMFMSHYIDVPGLNLTNALTPENLSDFETANSNETANWITDYDRRAYETYFNSLGAGEAMKGIGSICLNAISLAVGKYAEIENASKINQRLNYTSIGIGYVGSVFVGKSMLNAINEKYTPEELIARMKREYSDSDATREAFSFMSNTLSVLSLVVENPIPIMLSFYGYMATSYINGVAKLMDHAAWAAMTASRNMRISYRYMRMYGMI